MKKILFVLFMAAGMMSFASCSESAENRTENHAEEVEDTAEEAGEDMEEGAEDAGEAAEEKAE